MGKNAIEKSHIFILLFLSVAASELRFRWSVRVWFLITKSIVDRIQIRLNFVFFGHSKGRRWRSEAQHIDFCERERVCVFEYASIKFESLKKHSNVLGNILYGVTVKNYCHKLCASVHIIMRSTETENRFEEMKLNRAIKWNEERNANERQDFLLSWRCQSHTRHGHEHPFTRSLCTSFHAKPFFFSLFLFLTIFSFFVCIFIRWVSRRLITKQLKIGDTPATLWRMKNENTFQRWREFFFLDSFGYIFRHVACEPSWRKKWPEKENNRILVVMNGAQRVPVSLEITLHESLRINRSHLIHSSNKTNEPKNTKKKV